MRAEAVAPAPGTGAPEATQPHVPLIDDAAGWAAGGAPETKPLLTRAQPLGRTGAARIATRAAAVVVLLVALVALVLLLSAVL